MSDARRTWKEWALTGEAFERFLSCLDADTERAGEKYEAIRQKLLKDFDWRGAHFPEECADETIDRVVRKLESGETIRDIPTYCLGVARLIFLETLKKPDNRQVGLDELSAVAAPLTFQEEERAERECFARCLNELPVESRQLILQYYRDDLRDKINNRQEMAESLGIQLNALRSRVQRLRDKPEARRDRAAKRRSPTRSPPRKARAINCRPSLSDCAPNGTPPLNSPPSRPRRNLLPRGYYLLRFHRCSYAVAAIRKH